MSRRFVSGRYKASSSPEALPSLSWTTTVTTAGAIGDVWEARLMGNVVQYVQVDTNTTNIADGLAAAIDLLAGITSTNSGAVMTTTRSSAPDSEDDAVGELAIRVFRPDHPFPGPSAARWTQVVATAGTGFAIAAARYDSVPEPH